ncbi:Cu/Ag efflux protein CusF [Nitrobacteraceae bacterium AZCC 2161]|jgi:Cu/Ag efflux protein CusF
MDPQALTDVLCAPSRIRQEIARGPKSTITEEQTRSFRLIPDCSTAERFSMRLAKMVLTGSMLTVISSVALAQQALTGMVTTIDRISGTIAIQQTQGGTVGASTGGAAEQFKVQESLLNTVHAGDKVTFSVSETGGTKTITKLEKQ